MDPSALSEPMVAASVNLAHYGFAPALVVAVSDRGAIDIAWRAPALLKDRGMAYAALRDDGLPLVTGAARDSLAERWHRILDVIAGDCNWRPGRLAGSADPRLWCRAVQGRRFQVWARKSLASDDLSALRQDATALAGLLRPGLGTSAGQQCAANGPTPPGPRHRRGG